MSATGSANEKAAGVTVPDDYPEPPAPESEDQESEEEEWRFHGPDSTWRNYTQEERALVASLDQAEHNDLSIHLYNAHAWKKSLRDASRNAAAWQSKQSWLKKDDTGKTPFVPANTWTAWPLKSMDVPRRNEVWGVPASNPTVGTGTYHKTENWRPGLDLEDSIKAEIFRKAKERFQTRQWLYATAEMEVETRSLSRPSEELRESSDDEYSFEADPSSSQSSDEDIDLSQRLRTDALPSSHQAAPTLTVDDEVTESLARPTARHIMSKLDQILIGLHNSRQGHRVERSRSRSRNTRWRSRHQSPATPSSRDPAADDAMGDDFPDASVLGREELSDGVPRARTPRRQSRRHRLGTRDWSEVLGTAALVGWDQSTIDRTARRCATLFGESMEMRIMPNVDVAEHQESLIKYAPDMFPPLGDTSGDAALSEDENEDEKRTGVPCPHVTCVRHEEPFAKRWRLHEHLKRKHKSTREDIEVLESQRQELDSAMSPVPIK